MTKKRGRPVGSGYEADEPVLVTIADMVVRTGVRFTKAYKSLHPDSWTESAIRRVQKKWKTRREALVSAAQQRLEAERTRHLSAVTTPRTDPYAAMRAAQASVQKIAALSNLGIIGRINELMRSADFINSPAVVSARRLHERMAETTAFAEYPAIAKMRALQESLAFKTLRQQQSVFDALGM